MRLFLTALLFVSVALGKLDDMPSTGCNLSLVSKSFDYGETSFNYRLECAETYTGNVVLGVPQCDDVVVTYATGQSSLIPNYLDSDTGISGFHYLPSSMDILIKVEGDFSSDDMKYSVTTSTSAIDDVEGPTCSSKQPEVVCNAGESYTAECSKYRNTVKVALSGYASTGVTSYSWSVSDGQLSSSGTPSTVLSFTDYCENDITATLTVSGKGKASDTCTATVSVKDITPPTFSLQPGDITVEVDDFPAPALVLATDTCDAQVDITLAETMIQLPGASNYLMVRTWTAEDDCSNVNTHVQTITVQDTVPPTLVGVAADVEVNCDAVPPPCLVECIDSAGSCAVTLSESKFNVACTHSYDIIRHWIASDAAGNIVEDTQTVVVIDNEAPFLIGVPENTSVECDEVPNSPTVTATDSCANAYDEEIVVSFSSSESVRAQPDEKETGTITRCWTAVDTCGNSESQCQEIIIYDSNPPTITGVEDHKSIPCGVDVVPCLVNANDDCSGATITFSETKIPGSCDQEFKLVHEWVASDALGQTASETQTIAVSDTVPPVISGVSPAATTIACNNQWENNAVVEDNCDPNPSLSFVESRSDTDCNNYILYRDWSAADDCGNTDEAQQTITVKDSEDPIIDAVPPHQTLFCENIPTAPELTARDNCDADVAMTYSETSLPGSCDDEFTRLRKWSATDCSGRSVTETQTIKFIDITPPFLVGCPGDKTIPCDQNVPGAPEISASDNCAVAPVSLYTSNLPGSCPESYDIVREWSSEDACGNSASHSQTVTVTDTEGPSLTEPEDTSAECDVSSAPQVDVSDNCDEDPGLTLVETSDNGSCPEKIIREWTSTDSCGNTGESVDQTVTVWDRTPPVFTASFDAHVTINCDSDTDWDQYSSPPAVEVTDNCDNVEPTYDVKTVPGCGHGKSIERKWYAVDACGNAATALSQVITVIDEQIPTLTPVQDVTTGCGEEVPEPPVTASYTCQTYGSQPVAVTKSSSRSDECGSGYTEFRVWEAVTDCGKFASVNQTVTAVDTTPPTIADVPSSDTISCEIFDGNYLTGATASDDCSTVSLTEATEYKSDDAYALETTVGLYITTWTAEDECGFTAVETATITVDDKVPPGFTSFPEDTTEECTGTPEEPTVADSCNNEANLSLEVSENGGDCDKFETRTYTVTDHYGNVNSKTQVIRYMDTTPPYFTGYLPNATLSLECDETIPDTPVTGDDDCTDASVTMAESESDDGAYTIVTVRVWTISDECGNFKTHTQEITRTDTTPPTVTAPGDESYECDEVAAPPVEASDNCGSATVTKSESSSGSCPEQIIRCWTAEDHVGNMSPPACQTIYVDDITPPEFGVVPEVTTAQSLEEFNQSPATDVTVSDNCEYVGVTREDSTVDELCHSTIIHVYTAMDSCGNTATETGSTTLEYTTPPEFTVPDDTTVECDDSIPEYTTPTITNNDGSYTFQFTIDDVEPEIKGCEYVIVRTFTVVDHCDNAETMQQSITVVDTTPPEVFGLPDDTTKECWEVEDYAPATNVSVSDACSETTTYKKPGVSLGPLPDLYPKSIDAIEHYWNISDVCGNNVEYYQTIHILDYAPPQFRNNLTDKTNWTHSEFLEGYDIEGPDPYDCWKYNVTLHETSEYYCEHGYEIYREYFTTDSVGNVNSIRQTISVVDNVPPVLKCKYCAPGTFPQDETTSSMDELEPEYEEFTATDEEAGDVPVTYSFSREDISDKKFIVYREWVAEDECGNTAVYTQKIVHMVVEAFYQNRTHECATAELSPTEEEVEEFILAQQNESYGIDISVTQTRDGEDDCEFSVIRTWVVTARDNGALLLEFSQTNFYKDTGKPTFVDPPTVHVFQNETTCLPPSYTVVATDACTNVSVTLTETEGPTTGASYGSWGYTLYRVWVAEDECGHTDEHKQTVHVRDRTPPVWDEPLPSTTVSADCADIPSPATLTASDPCCDPDITFKQTGDAYATSEKYEIIRTWTAQNCGEKTAEFVQTVFVDDSTDPVCAPLEDITIECGGTPPVTNPSCSDDCDEDVSVTGPSTGSNIGACPYYYVKTWTATDNCDNEGTADQTVYVSDTTPPELTGVPEDVTLECGDSMPYAANVTADDECDGDLGLTESTIEIEDGCTIAWVTTYWAEDSCGNVKTAESTLTVVDTTPPVLACESCNDQVTAECGDKLPEQPYTVSDCTTASITLSETVSDTSYGCTYYVYRVWDATDICGNVAQETQTIEVTDNTNPTVTAPPNDTGVCSPPAYGEPIVGDSCGAQHNRVTYSKFSTSSGDCPTTIINEYIVDDGCGNTASDEQTVVVDDVTPPVFSDVSDTTETCDDIQPVPPVTVSDNCDTVQESYSSSKIVDGGCVYTEARQWSAVDDCGNSATQEQTVQVIDDTPPTLESAPESYTDTCKDYYESPSELSASDSCGAATVTREKTEFGNTCEQNVVYTWTATDCAGNTDFVDQTITILDVTPPKLTAPHDSTVECNLGDAVNVNVTDDCSAVVYSAVSASGPIDISPAEGAYIDYKMYEYSWTGSDVCGLDTTVTQTVTVIDTTPPTISVPQSETFECTELNVQLGLSPSSIVVNVTDECAVEGVTNSVSQTEGSCEAEQVLELCWSVCDEFGNTNEKCMTKTFIDSTPPSMPTPAPTSGSCSASDPTTPTAQDECSNPGTVPVSVSSSMLSSTCDYDYVKEFVFTASDDCGNVAEVSATATATDNTPPEFSKPEDVSGECPGVPPVPPVSASDNCDSLVEITLEETKVDGSCSGAYTINRVWTGVDDCGNSEETTQTVTIYDATPPEISFETDPENPEYAECDMVPAAAVPIATDTCGPAVVEVTYTSTKADGSCDDQYDIYRQWYAADDCGNSDIATQTVNVVDTTAPSISGPSDTTVPCDAIPQDNVTVTDNCDDDVDLTCTEALVNPGTCDRSISRVCSASDDCGNTAEYNRIITVYDDNTPQWVNTYWSAETTVECTNIPPVVVSDLALIAACDDSVQEITPTVKEWQDPTTCTSEYDVVRAFKASDDCGNSITRYARVTVVDLTPPALNDYPNDVTVQCDSIPDACVISIVPDDCDPDVETTDVDFSETEVTIGGFKSLVRSWYAADCAGNSVDHAQTVTIIDSSPPVFSRNPPDSSVECDCDSFPSASVLTALDNCDLDLQVTFSETKETGSSPDEFTLFRSWTVSDSSNNMNEWSQTIWVTDDSPPTFLTNPDDTTVACGKVPTDTTLAVRDNCDEDVEEEFSETTNTTPDDCDQNYSIERLWSATDRTGNKADYAQTIQVEDIVAPFEMRSMPEMCIVPSGGVVTLLIDDLFDVTDSCSDVTVTLTSCNSTQVAAADVGVAFPEACSISDGNLLISGTSDPAIATGRYYTVYATAEDECGNEITVERKFWVPASIEAAKSSGKVCQTGEGWTDGYAA